MQQSTVTIWDPYVRIFHWCLVLSFVVAWISPDSWMDLHHWAGYAATALILLRVLWGLKGSHYARFSQFLRERGETLDYLTSLTERDEPRYLGHNPAGALMVVGLIIVVSVTSITGWMYTLDTFWGVGWVEELHEIASHLMLIMVVAHILGVIYASVRHRENLVYSMLTGKKRVAEGDDIA
jgi:cytochrome b